MGLLSRIDSMNQPGPGLLAKAELLGKKNSNFSEWASEKGFALCGIFSCCKSFYYFSHAYGFDLESLARSVSTGDFWKGLVSDNSTWCHYTNNELLPFMQLFSDNIKSLISDINIFPFAIDNQTYYFISCDNLTEEQLQSLDIKYDLVNFILNPEKTPDCDSFDDALNLGLSVSPASLFIITPKLALDSAFKDFEEELRNLIAQTAMNILYSKLKSLFQAPNCIYPAKNNEIKIVMFGKEEIDDKLLQFHINSHFNVFFNNQNPHNILVLIAGMCPNLKGTKMFLTQD